MSAERAGPDGLARRRDQRLRALVDHARLASPFYRRLYDGLPAAAPALVDLPPVTKPQLMADFDSWVTDPAVTLAGLRDLVADPARIGTPYLGRYFVGTTSGTTGQPGIFVHDERACAVYESFTFRIDRAWLSPRQWWQLERRRGRWAAVVSTGAHYAGAGWMERQRLRSRWKRGHYRVLSAQEPLDATVGRLNAFDPVILTGYPSVVDLLAEEQRAGRLRINPAITELAGESLSRAGRTRIAGSLGGALHEVYSASEFMILAFDCVEGRLHVNSDWAVLEPVDEQHRPTPPGEASYTVLLTNLANFVQPLIRYDLGDSVVAQADPCRCGSPLPAIRVQGRCDDVLRFTDARGRVVALPPLALGSAADHTPGVRRSQLVMTSPTTLRIRLDTESGADPDAVWRAVRSATGGYLASQGLTGVDVVRAQEPPDPGTRGGKYRQVIAAPTAEA